MSYLVLEAEPLLEEMASKVPAALHDKVIVIGSIATAWQFRDVMDAAPVATKDIDLLLQPAINAAATAQTLGEELLAQGWQPHFPAGLEPGNTDTPAEKLPALRLTPPGHADGWFVELLGEPMTDQTERKRWRRFTTPLGDFGLPSFRYMRVAVFDADTSPFGIRIAKPACMALAHLLEHADPDRTPISNMPGTPPRFTKDVGRAIALWWLEGQKTPLAAEA